MPKTAPALANSSLDWSQPVAGAIPSRFDNRQPQASDYLTQTGNICGSFLDVCLAFQVAWFDIGDWWFIAIAETSRPQCRPIQQGLGRH